MLSHIFYCLLFWLRCVTSLTVSVLVCLATQSCLTVCHPMDGSLPGSSVHGILQARILEWVAMPSSRGSSQPRDRTQVSCIAGRFFTIWATRDLSSSCLQQGVGSHCRLALLYGVPGVCLLADMFKSRNEPGGWVWETRERGLVPALLSL